MQLRNYMEDLVDSTIDELYGAEDAPCGCEHCRLDVKALALNQLPAKYAVTDKGYAFNKVHELESQFKTDVTVAVAKAMKHVREHPRHEC